MTEQNLTYLDMCQVIANDWNKCQNEIIERFCK